MPYTVKGKCVYKKEDGSKVGCTKGSVEKYLAALHANANESIEETLNETPSIFSHTIYRYPTKDELKELNTHNLNSKEILDGFYYTMVGRGMLDNKNKKMIIESISQLISMYPTNNEYKKALETAKELKGRFVNESKHLIKNLLRKNLGLL